MTAYYNEIDPYAAQWLRNLIAAGHIAAGDVDERSILDVRPDDLRGYTQAHFFAGIGGWSLALRLAGWPDDRPVWTGSCPCQPFSAAGKGKAADDERHLWPRWFPLIAELRPAIVFGEQVEAAIGWGWIDLIFADLESESYACGQAVLPACSVGAPHIRARTFWMADALQPASERRAGSVSRTQAPQRGPRRVNGHRPDGPADGGEARELAYAEYDGGRPDEPRGPAPRRKADGRPYLMANPECRRPPGRHERPAASPANLPPAHRWACDWLPCTDGKARPVEPGTFPLAHGIPGRVGRLRAYGNAIVPQVAAEFIRAAI